MDVSTGDAAVDRLMKIARRVEREGKKETAEIIYSAASEIARLRAEFRGDEDIGYLMVDTVTNFVCDDAETGARWHDEFRAFYQPAKWFGSHRAAAAFLAGKWLKERASRPNGTTPATSATGSSEGGK